MGQKLNGKSTGLWIKRFGFYLEATLLGTWLSNLKFNSPKNLIYIMSFLKIFFFLELMSLKAFGNL